MPSGICQGRKVPPYLLPTFGVIDSGNEFPITFFVSKMFYPVSPGMVIFNLYRPFNFIFLSYNSSRSNRLSYLVNTTLIFCPYTESRAVSYTHLRAHETRHDLVCRLL